MINKLIKLFQKKEIKQEIKQEEYDKLKKDLDKLKQDLLEVFKNTRYMISHKPFYKVNLYNDLCGLTYFYSVDYNKSIAEQFRSFSQTYYKLNDTQKSEMLLLYRNTKKQDKSYKIDNFSDADQILHEEMALFLCSEVQKLSKITAILPPRDYHNYDDYLTGKK
jgi:hypothetical protein